jgi:hypothetical protein
MPPAVRQRRGAAGTEAPAVQDAHGADDTAVVHENPGPTEEEQEQVPERLEEAEEMRGPLESDPELPTEDGDEN